jgi:hypothetical protein
MEKEFKNIDDLLRDSLSNLEQKPSSSVWKKISNTLPGNYFSGMFYSKTFWTVLTGIVAVVLFLLINRTSTLTETKTEVYNNSQPATIQNQNLNSADFSDKKEIKDLKEFKLETENQSSTSLNSDPASFETATELKGSDNLSAETFASSSMTKNKMTQKYLISGYYPFLMKRTFDEQIYQDYSFITKPDYLKARNSLLNFNLPGQPSKDDYGKKQNFLYGVHLTPELIIPGNDQTNKGIGFELTGRYLMKDFYLETGLGMNISDDDGNFTIDYEQFDSIGYYYKVLSFTIDENSGEPVFHTDLEAVYDTVGYSTSEVLHNTYTYLYLPLYAGVKMYEYKRLNLNLQTGIIYSILINSQEPEATYTNDKATQISITNENPDKISSNWQMAASLGIQYQLNQSLSLNIEPVFKYYFKPEYERRYNPKSKFGTGLRIGIYVKF